ncbi:MAG: hypothetical protein HZB92_01720 [Euryarchaeota archaeon]|nr:hypothetical protein [Euryarchaeota archaeon]
MNSQHKFADVEFVNYLTAHRYHPRSSKHGDFICEKLVSDLAYRCPLFKKHTEEHSICYKLNYTVNPSSPLKWTIDLVVGPCGDKSQLETNNILPPRGTPKEIWLAVDAKSIMTEHGKARRNRVRDIDALHNNLHAVNQKTVVGGLLVINISPTFYSPLRTDGITEHHNVERLVAESIQMFETVPRADSPTGGKGLDAMGVIIVDYSNQEGAICTIHTREPAPAIGSKVHYLTFIDDLCHAYTSRFS